MSNDLMDPREFAVRLERSFGAEPPHAPPGDDVSRGRRRRRRRQVGASVAALATLGAVGAASTLAQGLLGGQAPGDAPVAAQALTSDDIVARCTTGENAVSFVGHRSKQEHEAVALLGADPRLMTSAAVERHTEATLLSQDGKYWGDCQFRNAADNGVKNLLVVYPTDVSFPPRVVDGVRAYQPHSESDPRLSGTATVPMPQFEVGCLVQQPEETAAWDREAATCPEFTVYWNDRRPDEVAAVRVTTPDGASSWADVEGGYLSFAYSGTMTPALAARVAAGELVGATQVTFFDEDGNVLVDDHDPGHLPVRAGDLSIQNFPSLGWWLS